MTRLTPDDVRTVAFDTAPLGRRGYLMAQVDAFLDRVDDALSGRTIMTSDEVREVTFGMGGAVRNRGYDEHQVDAFLELVAETLSSRERPPSA
jgi:DivIVA domain-containing protein